MIAKTGIIAEFNPLHKGHEYIMAEAKNHTGADAIVIAMSGNFVQRGEAAILDKWTRTKLALKSGADLVIEIPSVFCLGDASIYANAGVHILESLGISKICCGSESGSSDMIYKLANFIKINKNAIDAEISKLIKSGISYPAAREKVISCMISEGGTGLTKASLDILKRPNDILALEYAMAGELSTIECIKRFGSEYNDDYIEDSEYQSAHAIRNILRENDKDIADSKLQKCMSPICLKEVMEADASIEDNLVTLLRYAALMMSPDEIDNCPSGGEGLGNLIRESVKDNNSIKEIITEVKSKRYTYTRISRLCMQIILGINRNNLTYKRPKYLRVLGFTDKGREILSDVKSNKTCKLPIITNINKEFDLLDDEAKEMLKLDIKASDIHNLASGKDLAAFSDHRITLANLLKK